MLGLLNLSKKEGVLIAKLGRPVGLKGWMRLWLCHPAASDLLCNPLWISAPHREDSFSLVADWQVNSSHKLIKLKQACDRDESAKWVHAKLWKRRTDFSDLQALQIPTVLLGLSIVIKHGPTFRRYGRVRHVYTDQSPALLQIACDEESKRQELYLPIVPKVSIDSVNLLTGTIYITEQAGHWLDTGCQPGIST